MQLQSPAGWNMNLDLTTTPFLRDGAPAILSAAWIDPTAVAAATPAQRAAQVALILTFRPDCLLWPGDPAGGVNFAQAIAFARETDRPVAVAEAPLHPAPPGLLFCDPARPLPFPTEVCAEESRGCVGCPPANWIIGWVRNIAAGSTAWATRLFALPPDARDHRPAERFARIAHRLQSFTRKHGGLLVRSKTLAGSTGYTVVESPARLELTLRQLEERPVVTLFAMNPSAHPVDGRLVLAIPVFGREIDLGRLIIPAGRFAVLQITRDRERRTRLSQPPPDRPRKKGCTKADHTREVDLLNTGIRIQTLFRATQV